jgi:hypothetical protein
MKITTLRKELTNSEELQRDLISLSKSLQMGLESIRQAETEVRWQHPEDILHCNSCKRTLNDLKDKVRNSVGHITLNMPNFTMTNHLGQVLVQNRVPSTKLLYSLHPYIREVGR